MFKAEPAETFLILSMMFGASPDEREPKLGAVKNVTPPRRNEMQEAGLIRFEKRGRATHIVLDDGAWDFLLEQMGQPLPRTPSAAKVLQSVLARVRLLLERESYPITEFLGGAATAAEERVSTGTAAGTAAGRTDGTRRGATFDGATEMNRSVTAEQIRDACLELTGGKLRERIRLAELRRKLPANRESLDRGLFAMQASGTLVLFRMDNPAEITEDDESAALFIAGNPRHLVYLEG